MMDDEDFTGLSAGLADAAAYLRGNEASGRVVAGPDVRAIRKATNLSQHAFADAYRFKVATVRDWEQGRRAPDAGSVTLLRMIAIDPAAVKRLIAKV